MSSDLNKLLDLYEFVFPTVESKYKLMDTVYVRDLKESLTINSVLYRTVFPNNYNSAIDINFFYHPINPSSNLYSKIFLSFLPFKILDIRLVDDEYIYLIQGNSHVHGFYWYGKVKEKGLTYENKAFK